MSKIKEAAEALLNSDKDTQEQLDNGPKQYLIFNRNLNMPSGKLAAQLSHASMGCVLSLFEKVEYPEQPDYVILRNKFNKDSAEYEWMFNKFTKVVLYVKSEEKLKEIYDRAQAENITSVIIKDEGRTFFNEPTITCVGIGPVYPSLVRHIVGKLQLYKD
jgi:PTH2 family peptidyl-tRNA hydrolase